MLKQHTGEKCILAISETDKDLGIHSEKIPDFNPHNKYLFKIWAKGEGKFYFSLVMYDKNGKFIPPQLNTTYSKWFNVLNEWKEYSFIFNPSADTSIGNVGIWLRGKNLP